ncbi:MAG: YitT family protein [Mogibacterium sp.]|nr:YitT family protein [Mogibacterium sp.]
MSSNEENKAVSSLDKKLEREAAVNKKVNAIYANDPELHGKSRFQARAQEIGLALLAVIIGSLGTVGIMLPNGLTFGGITGIARIIQKLTGVNYSLIYYVLAFIVLIIVGLFLGFKEIRKIALMSVSYPTVMMVLELKKVVLIKSDDLFLVAVFCGVVLGISNGLTFKAGFSSGGTDSLAKVIKYRWLPHLGINDITFAINALIVLASVFVFGLQIALYAVIIIFVSMRVGETVMYGFSDKIVELDIIPGDAEALADYIMNELGRGVSSIEVTGEYTGDKRKQLKILCSPRESFLIKRHLAKEDPKSFVSVISIKSVWGRGRGFSDIRSMDN